METTQVESILNQLAELTKKIIILETNDKSKDREIKEIKDTQQVLTTTQNGLALTNQKILSEVEYLRNDFKDVKSYIEEIKTQPRKDKDNFVKAVVGAIIAVVVSFIAYSLGLKG